MSERSRKRLPSAFPCDLADGEVHVWKVDLAIEKAMIVQACRFLSPDEHWKASRFCSPDDQRRFVAAHAALRIILGNYLHLSPKNLVFFRGPFGKPALRSDQNSERLSFNLSHSHNLALIGVCRDRDLGVDIEYLDETRASNGVAQRFFASEEVEALNGFAGPARVLQFFRTWVRKEAYIKARGEGVYLGLDTFAIAEDQNDAAALARSTHERNPQDWRFSDLTIHPNYAAALAIKAPRDFVVRLHKFPWGTREVELPTVKIFSHSCRTGCM